MLFISVYAPQYLLDKSILWSKLLVIITRWKSMVVVTGEFNEVREVSESFGLVFHQR